ncbi:MAG: hypothetical protein FJZ16_09405 [Candidatus Omnitrophica bacterium]|nr:hypothetical protein [Candidatus Omnitrophota bacterium]MBM4432785.1 hypothetical protein [Chloroflexota bacterium]
MAENKTVYSAYRICVHLTTGEVKEHLYPNSTNQDLKKAREAMDLISSSFTRSALDFKIFQIGNPKIIPLQYPDVVYNPSYVLYVEHGPIKKNRHGSSYLLPG